MMREVDDSDSRPPPPSYVQASSPLLVEPPPPRTSAEPTSSSTCDPRARGHAWDRLNLPSGMFLVKNRGASGKTLDLVAHKTHEGAPFGLHPVKRPTLRGLSLQHANNNQLFFVDWNGHLYSAAASRAVDVVFGRVRSDLSLALALPHPVQPFPSAQSHPLPRFELDRATSTLHVVFSHDPTYPPPLHPTAASESSFEEYDYLVEAVPVRNDRARRNQVPRGSVSSQVARKAGQAIELLSSLYPFAQSPRASPILDRTGPRPRRRREGEGAASPRRVDDAANDRSQTLDQKRLPRHRDASLPPPPIPSKDDDEKEQETDRLERTQGRPWAGSSSTNPPVLPDPSSSPRISPLTDLFPSTLLAVTMSSPSPGSDREGTSRDEGTDEDDDNSGRAQSTRDDTLPKSVSRLSCPASERARVVSNTERSSGDPERGDAIASATSSSERDSDSSDSGDSGSGSDSDSDNEPSAFRPVRIVRLLKSSNWRETEFPFESEAVTPTVTNGRGSNKVSPPRPAVASDALEFVHGDDDRGEEGVKRAPIGLGFEDAISSTADITRVDRRRPVSPDRMDDDDAVGVEDVWPEQTTHGREISFASSTTVLDHQHLHDRERERELDGPVADGEHSSTPAGEREGTEDKPEGGHERTAVIERARGEAAAAAAAKKTRRTKRRRLKEMRKWRRRQWDVVPVTVEPVPLDHEYRNGLAGGGGGGSSSGGSSWRVHHELESEDMYRFRGGVTEAFPSHERSDFDHDGAFELAPDEDDDEEEGCPHDERDGAGAQRGRRRRLSSSLVSGSLPLERSVGPAPAAASNAKRGSIETAKSVVSGVGSFLTTRLLWSVSTSSTPEVPPRRYLGGGGGGRVGGRRETNGGDDDENDEDQAEAMHDGLPPLPLPTLSSSSSSSMSGERTRGAGGASRAGEADAKELAPDEVEATIIDQISSRRTSRLTTTAATVSRDSHATRRTSSVVNANVNERRFSQNAVSRPARSPPLPELPPSSSLEYERPPLQQQHTSIGPTLDAVEEPLPSSSGSNVSSS